MREAASRSLSLLVIVAWSLTLFGCGDGVELRPELQAHLDEYESLIETFEPKFRAARGNPSELAEVSTAYSEKAKAWIREWDTVAPDLSEEEGRAIQAVIDRLNKRAERMLTGG